MLEGKSINEYFEQNGVIYKTKKDNNNDNNNIILMISFEWLKIPVPPKPVYPFMLNH